MYTECISILQKPFSFYGNNECSCLCHEIFSFFFSCFVLFVPCRNCEERLTAVKPCGEYENSVSPVLANVIIHKFERKATNVMYTALRDKITFPKFLNSFSFFMLEILWQTFPFHCLLRYTKIEVDMSQFHIHIKYSFFFSFSVGYLIVCWK